VLILDGLPRAAMVGPPVTPGSAGLSDLTWSANGRYLAWWESPLNASMAHPLLVWVDTTTATYKIWSSPADSDMPASLVVDSTGVTVDAARHYSVSGSVTGLPMASSNFAAHPWFSGTFSDVVSSANGFIGLSLPIGEPQTVWRMGLTGVGEQVAVLPSAAPHSPYETFASNLQGDVLAVEQGDHTDLCGVGPTSWLLLTDLRTGWSVFSALPAIDGVRRFRSMAFGPNDVLDVAVYDCLKTSGLATALLEYRGGKWTTLRPDVLDAACGPHGELAYISGSLKVPVGAVAPYAVPTGPQNVIV
jgi:hypothetical protein